MATKNEYFVPVHGKDDTFYVKISKRETDRLLLTGAFQASVAGWDGRSVYIEAKD